jgi:hypothetical protein
MMHEIIRREDMRHRPRVTGQGATVTVHLGPLQLKALDEWRQGQLDQPSRSEAIRRLLLVAFTLKAMTNGRSPGRGRFLLARSNRYKNEAG